MSFTNLGFSEPTPLDPATQNVWGATINENFTLIDSAISGFLVLDVSGSSNVNLTVATGAPDQSRNARFVFEGVLTGNIIVFFPPSRTLLFSVKNATSGAFTLTIACGTSPTALGETVAVPQGGNSQLNSNGIDIERSVDTVGLGAQAGSGVVGDARNAAMAINTVSSIGTFTADVVTVGTSLNGTIYSLSSYSQVINLALVGAGGMDIGQAPISGYVSLYAIYNPTTLAISILACNASISTTTIYSGANMPSGYLANALVGIWPTDSSRRFLQGRQAARVMYRGVGGIILGSNTPGDISLAASVPPGATSWGGYAGVFTGGTGAVAGRLVLQPTSTNNGGAVQIFGASAAGAFGALSNAFYVPFSEVPIITPQTVNFSPSATTGGAWFIYCTRYTF